MRVGVVGAGAIAVPHVEAWQALGAEVVVHSRRPPTEFAQRHGTGTAASLDELVGDCDVVDVCSPTPTHDDVVLAAVASGRPVVCEKPLARTSHRAQALVDAAARAGVLLFPAHVVRYFPAYEGLRARLAAGEVGPVDTLTLTRQVAAPADDSWFHDVTASGGVVLDLMLHDLDQALWLLGPVERVSAQALDGGGRHVRATVVHEGGATSTVEAHWGPPGTPFATSYAVHGVRGSLQHDSASDADVGEDPYLRQLRDVVEHLRTGRPTRVPAQDGVAVVALAERVLAALAPGG